MIKLASLTGGSIYERDEIINALSALNQIWSGDKLKAKVLAHQKLNGSSGFENTDDTPEQVWAKMQAADVVIDVLIYQPSWWERMKDRMGKGVVGYEDSDGVHVNGLILDGESMPDVADNLAHETFHQLGYTHDFNPTPERPYSAPYGVGVMVGEVLGG